MTELSEPLLQASAAFLEKLKQRGYPKYTAVSIDCFRDGPFSNAVIFRIIAEPVFERPKLEPRNYLTDRSWVK